VKSLKEQFLGKDRSEEGIGEKIAGGSDHRKELADEIIDSVDTPLDPEEQEMVHEEIEKAKKREKRNKVQSMVKEKLEEKRNQKDPDGSALAGAPGKTDAEDLVDISEDMV